MVVEAGVDPQTPFCFRVRAHFSGQRAQDAFGLFAAVEQRAQWDSMCQSVRILKQIDPLTFIYHLKLKATWPTSARDSLVMAAFRKLSDGRYISVAWSIEDDSICPPDPSNTFIRMHTRISANLFTPVTPNSFILSQLIDADPKGSIPAYLIKKVSAKAFPETVASVRAAITRRMETQEFDGNGSEIEPDIYDQIISNDRGKNEIYVSVGSADSDSDSFSSDPSFSPPERSRELHEILLRLQSIDQKLAEFTRNRRQAETKTGWVQWAPVAFSAASFLLLLNLNCFNLRKK